jgi:hypothetical protein
MSDENDPYYTDAEERRQAINAILECTKYWPCTREHRVFKGLLAEITRLRAELAERGAELAFERAEIAALKDRIATALLDKAAVERGVMRLRADLAQRTAERDALAAEVAALKANDPLAEMWRELAEYQPFADRDGHGESWRIMCSERTTPAAWEAWGDAVRVLARHEARVAARSAGDAASLHSAFDAVTAIRKAKEAKP